jgi:hypothetical protein
MSAEELARRIWGEVGEPGLPTACCCCCWVSRAPLLAELGLLGLRGALPLSAAAAAAAGEEAPFELEGEEGEEEVPGGDLGELPRAETARAA